MLNYDRCLIFKFILYYKIVCIKTELVTDVFSLNKISCLMSLAGPENLEVDNALHSPLTGPTNMDVCTMSWLL